MPNAMAFPPASGVAVNTTRFTPAVAVTVAVIVAVACVDLALHVRSNSLTLWNPNPPASLRELERARFDVPPDGPRWTAPALQGTKLNLVQRIPVVEGYSGLVSSEFTRLARSRFSEVLGEHRYWLSPSAWSVVPVEAGIAALSQLGAGDGIPVFSDRTESRPPGEPVAPGTYGAVTVVSYLPERVEFHASVPGDGAILASTERFAPSWRVAVDGLERPIRVVNFLFRGVAVPPGEHVVVFTYDPAPFAPLLVLSHALIVLASGAAVLLWRRERGAAGGSQGRRSVNAPPEPFGQG